MLTKGGSHNNRYGAVVHRFSNRARWVFHTVHRFDESLRVASVSRTWFERAGSSGAGEELVDTVWGPQI